MSNESSGRSVGCSATVSASREQVNEASREWAKDMRWYAADLGNIGPCVFRLNRVTWMLRNPTIEVIASQHRHGTDVEFRASLDLTNPPVWDSDLRALAVRFARGVCCELARQGATIEPASLGSLCPPRTLQKTVARVIVPLFYATVIGFVPVGILVGMVTRHTLLGFTVGGWLLLCYLTASLVRYRTAGMRARVVLFGFVTPCLIAVLVVTIASAVSY